MSYTLITSFEAVMNEEDNFEVHDVIAVTALVCAVLHTMISRLLGVKSLPVKTFTDPSMQPVHIMFCWYPQRAVT